MADIVYRANLKSSGFPFISTNQGRTVIVKGQDQNYVNGLAPKESMDASLGIPQVYYCHNVVPTDEGYRSVAYDTAVVSTYPSSVGFDSVVTLRDGAGNSALLSLTTTGELLILRSGAAAWTGVTGAPAASLLIGKRVTVAYISGITYIYFSGVGCYVYVFDAYQIVSSTLTGLTAADILGITASKGYMIAYSVDAIAWSSITDPTDFTPSLVTGAGGGSIEGAKGSIVTIEPVYGGMIVFTSGNAVAAVASDNVRYPYNFTEITNSGGVVMASHVSVNSSTKSVYAYTTSGFQSVSLSGAATTFSDVTDFLSGGWRESFDEATNTFTNTYFDIGAIATSIAIVADRYIVISYNTQMGWGVVLPKFNYALYYDISNKQWGKFKIDHVYCFEHEVVGADSPKKSIAFLDVSGNVYHANTAGYHTPEPNGVMILGKYQYVRSRLLTLQSVSFENAIEEASMTVHTIPSLDGKNLGTPVAGYLTNSTGKIREYNFRTTALNHSILIKGAFNAVSMVLTFTNNGAR